MAKVLELVEAVWVFFVTLIVFWFLICLWSATPEARSATYIDWNNLAVALNPWAPVGVAIWILNLFAVTVALVPYVVIQDIKKKLRKNKR
jgi:hypothetical protein